MKRTDVACPYCSRVVKVYDDPRTGEEKLRSHRDWFTGACPAGTQTYAQALEIKAAYVERSARFQEYRDQCRRYHQNLRQPDTD